MSVRQSWSTPRRAYGVDEAPVMTPAQDLPELVAHLARSSLASVRELTGNRPIAHVQVVVFIDLKEPV